MELIDTLYKSALVIGIKPDEFYDYTIKEVFDLINAHKERTEEQQKAKLVNNYSLAKMIRIAIVSSLNSDVEFPSIQEMFPSMFEDEVCINEEDQIKQQEIYFDMIMSRCNLDLKKRRA